MVQRACAAVMGIQKVLCGHSFASVSSSSLRSQLSSGSTRSAHDAGFHSSTRSIAPCTSTSFSSPANVRRWDGNRHAPLSIDLHLVGARCPQPCPVAIGATRLGPLLHDGHLPIEFPRGPKGQAALGLLRQVPASFELGTEFGGQDHPALDIERMLVSPHKSCHWPDLPRRSLNCVLERPSTPFRATLRPFPPPSNHIHPSSPRPHPFGNRGPRDQLPGVAETGRRAMPSERGRQPSEQRPSAVRTRPTEPHRRPGSDVNPTPHAGGELLSALRARGEPQ